MGNATIGLAVFVLAIPVVIVGGLIAAALPVVGVPLLVVAIGALVAVGAACGGVFNAALYRYATTGESSGAFSIEDMNASFRPRRGGRRSSPFTPGGFTGEGFGGGGPGPGPTSGPAPDRPDQ